MLLFPNHFHVLYNKVESHFHYNKNYPCREVIVELKEADATWIQVDEDTLVKDLEGYQLEAFSKAYSMLKSACCAEAFQILTSLPGVAGFSIDLIHGEKTLDLIKSSFPSGKYLFAGVVIVGSLAGHKDEAFFLANAAAQVSRKSSPRVTNESMQKVAAALRGSDHHHATNVSVRLDAPQKLHENEKSGGAWIDEVVVRIRVLLDDKNFVRLPIAHMVYNQMLPVGDKPSLMTFREGLPEGLEIAVELLSKTSRQGLDEFKLAMFYLIWTRTQRYHTLAWLEAFEETRLKQKQTYKELLAHSKLDNAIVYKFCFS
ncbi:unnamed protein product [Lactuca saligna]|uniref:Cobalamin-independent methionine synthase MetE N-terminal domain-containing protein n=1 Tax=Lactuca saligna TaxID=75948 RepID=A0AA35VRH4_LACSI|nr:unnamed protein product [Lactuca saligna]